MKPIVIMKDGRCNCHNNGDACPLGRSPGMLRCTLSELAMAHIPTVQAEPIKLMHNQYFGSVVDKYNRELRMHRLKRALAWCGVVAAGSLLVFCVGIFFLKAGAGLFLIDLAVIGLFAWGLWGFVHLKTRH